MGISAYWISFTGLTKDEVLERVDHDLTGAFSDPGGWLGRGESGLAILPGGRIVFVTDGRGIEEERLPEVSKGVEIVIGEMEEHVMYSRARLYREGQLVWSVVHDRDTYDEEIITEGDVPASLQDLMAEADREEAEGGGADYHFDVPINLALEFGGYRPLEEIDGYDQRLELTAHRAELRKMAANTAGEAERRAHRQVPGGLLGGLKRLFGG